MKHNLRYLRLSSFLIAFMSYACCGVASSAVTDSVTVYETAGSTQTNRPITISRVFAQGEIANYAQPIINGVPASTWQCDKKTTWSPAGGQPNGDGSLAHAVISFVATIPANGSITVTFRNNGASSSAGAPLTQPQMVNFNSGAWDADIEATGSAGCTANSKTGNTCAVDAKEMIGSGAWRYWLKGPVVTQVIVEDRTPSLVYDFGWDTYKPIHPIFIVTFYPSYTNGVKVDAILENDWDTKLEDQTYSVTMKSGPSLTSIGYSQSVVNHWAKARFRETFWSGTPLGGTVTDFNLAYMAYSKAISNFDTTNPIETSAVNAEVANWTNSSGYVPFTFNAGNTAAGQISTYMPMTGGREEIGLYPDWVVRWLYAMSNRNNNLALYPQLIGNAEIQAQIPWHYRESALARNYLDSTLDPAHIDAAFARPLSVDARPGFSVANPGNSNQYAGNDNLTAVGTIACQGVCGYPSTTTGGANYWTTDIAHHPDAAYVPYLITGDYYYLEEEQFLGSWVLASGNPDCGQNYHACGPAALVSEFAVQQRGMGWAFRSMGRASFVSPDASPERAYFIEKLNNNIQMKEGQYGLRNGAFYNPNSGGTAVSPCPNFEASTSTLWCRGYMVYHVPLNGSTPTPTPNPLALPMDWSNATLNTTGQNLTTSGGGASGFWMYWYTLNSWGQVRDFGFNITPLFLAVAKCPINVALNPAFAPALGATYREPVVDVNFNFFTSWAQVYNGYLADGTLAAPVSASDTSVTAAFAGATANGTVWDMNDMLIDIDSEKINVCAVTGGTGQQEVFNVGSCLGMSARGFAGTAPAAHANGTPFVLDRNFMPYSQTSGDPQNGYGTMFLAVLAQVADATDSDYTGLAAYNRIKGLMPSDFQSVTANNPKWAIVPRVAPAGSGAPNACDLNGDGLVNSADVQLASQQVVGSCGNLASIAGTCTVVALQRVVNASLGGACQTGQ